MYPGSEILGVCPHCGASIPDEQVLIEYETDTESAIYAECPECTAAVHPT
jgi:endogenous inhibitor of DNA gyrase (YacG/DUF329 family)